jgi:hypothetical protein
MPHKSTVLLTAESAGYNCPSTLYARQRHKAAAIEPIRLTIESQIFL